MHRKYGYFNFRSSKLHYSTFGEGEKVLFMFHGFGQSIKTLKGIEEALCHEYKVYNFDLFFHGFSEWNLDDTPLSLDYWKSMILAFLEENSIARFSLAGFSLGGKVALATLALFPDRIEHLYLIAPDGLRKNFWYNLVTSPLLKGLFRQSIMHPHWFDRLATLLRRLNLLDKSTMRFASLQMNSREKRRRVYYTWTVYKGIQPDIQLVIDLINQYHIRTQVFIGKYDRIIRYEHVQRFVSQTKECALFELNSGHNNLLDEVSLQLEKQMQRM